MDREGIAELLYEHDLITDYTTCGWVQFNGEWEPLGKVYNIIREQYITSVLNVNHLLACVLEELACID